MPRSVLVRHWLRRLSVLGRGIYIQHFVEAKRSKFPLQVDQQQSYPVVYAHARCGVSARTIVSTDSEWSLASGYQNLRRTSCRRKSMCLPLSRIFQTKRWYRGYITEQLATAACTPTHRCRYCDWKAGAELPVKFFPASRRGTSSWPAQRGHEEGCAQPFRSPPTSRPATAVGTVAATSRSLPSSFMRLYSAASPSMSSMKRTERGRNESIVCRFRRRWLSLRFGGGDVCRQSYARAARRRPHRDMLFDLI